MKKPLLSVRNHTSCFDDHVKGELVKQVLKCKKVRQEHEVAQIYSLQEAASTLGWALVEPGARGGAGLVLVFVKRGPGWETWKLELQASRINCGGQGGDCLGDKQYRKWAEPPSSAPFGRAEYSRG